MAACKSTVDGNLVVHIPSASLPMKCKLRADVPSTVTIMEVELFPAGGGSSKKYSILDKGRSFEIPTPPDGTSGNLFVRLGGDWPPATTIHVVEDCDDETLIVAIVDHKSKFGHATVEVE